MTSGDAKPPIPEGWAGEPLFILFFIPAPEALAIPHGSTLGIVRDETVDWLKGVPVAPLPGYTPYPSLDGENMVSVRIWRAEEEVKLDLNPLNMAREAIQITTGAEITESVLSSLSIEGPSYATVLEVVTAFLPSFDDQGDLDINQSISDAFDRCIESLADLYRPYIINFRDINVRMLGRTNVFPFIPWTTKDPLSDEDKFGGIGWFTPSPAPGIIPRTVDTASEPQNQRLLGILQRTKVGDPFTVYSEHSISASRSYWVDSDYPMTVVRSHIASEVLMNSILLLMAWEKGDSEEKVLRWSRRVLIEKIEKCYPNFLDGNWDTSDESTTIGLWKSCVHLMRNRVVHEGYYPTETEAWNALDMAGHLGEYMEIVLLKHWRSYPRTTLLMIGTEGLQRHDILSGDIRDVFERESHNIVGWLREFTDWAQKFRR